MEISIFYFIACLSTFYPSTVVFKICCAVADQNNAIQILWEPVSSLRSASPFRGLAALFCSLSQLAAGVGSRYISNVRRWRELTLLLLRFEYIAVWYFPVSGALWRAWEPVVCAFWSPSSWVRKESKLVVPADVWTWELFLRTAS